MLWLLHCSLPYNLHWHLLLSPMRMLHLFICPHLLNLNFSHHACPPSSLLCNWLLYIWFSSYVYVFICCSPGSSGSVLWLTPYAACGISHGVRTFRVGDCDVTYVYCWLLAGYTTITFVNFFNFCFLLLLSLLCYSSTLVIWTITLTQNKNYITIVSF